MTRRSPSTTGAEELIPEGGPAQPREISLCHWAWRGGALALVSEYAGDEDRDYLLRRLHDMARRFEGLCASKEEFKRLFPKLTAKQDALAEQPQQLSLF